MEEVVIMDLCFYKGKNVLVTGHTGFKGTWMCKILINAGAKVTGYSIEPQTEPSLFEISNIEDEMTSIMGDIRDYSKLYSVFQEVQPEIVFHLAAQPLVRESYENPHYTYETNVMGTVNILECIRQTKSVKSFLNVTTDKVYLNQENQVAFTEDFPLDGFDPYSNSKSCSELVTHSYKSSFFNESGIPISTARAGNVIGGGDFSKDRIIPDCIKATSRGEMIKVRNPLSIRPYQHVIEPVMTYLIIAMKQYQDISVSGYYNIGPDEIDCVETGTLVDMFCREWGEEASWKNVAQDNAPHEATFLKLNCDKIKNVFQWKPKWRVKEAVKYTVDFTKVYLNGGNISNEMNRQISIYMED